MKREGQRENSRQVNCSCRSPMVGEQGSFADGLGPTEEQRVEKKQEAGRCQTDGIFNGVGGRGV